MHSKFRKPLIIIALCLVIYVILDYNISDTYQSANYDTIWDNKCNHGIHFKDKCICPALYYGESCEIDQCSKRVEYQLYSAWTDDPKAKPEECPYPVEAIHCNREAINQKDAVQKYTINDFYSVKAKLEYIFEYYGPWSAEDKLMWHYLLKPEDFGPKGIVPNSANSLAFVFILHKSPDTFELLWPLIYRPHHQYIIHMDKKMSPSDMNRVRSLVRNHKNVEILAERFSGSWGTVSLVYMEMAAISRLVHKKGSWSHVINLSGDDFLIKPIKEIEQILSGLKKFSFLSIDPEMADRHENTWINCPTPGIKDSNSRMASWFVDKPSTMETMNYARLRISNTTFAMKGSQWHILSREAAEIVATDMAAIEMLFSMKYTLIPDEYFFQLIVKAWKLPFTGNDKRWINWEPDHQLYVLEQDIPALKSSNKFFARKVKPEVAPTLIKNLKLK